MLYDQQVRPCSGDGGTREAPALGSVLHCAEGSCASLLPPLSYSMLAGTDDTDVFGLSTATAAVPVSQADLAPPTVARAGSECHGRSAVRV